MTTTNPDTSVPFKGRYANILLDRWFKRTFGWAPVKRLMQLFLQELIPERTITEISFGPQEHINPIDQGKDIRLDVHCNDANGNLFIVEVQLSEQSTFYERAVFNSSFVIQEQLPPGRTDWGFAPIYFIGIVNFPIHNDSHQVLFRYRLREVESGEQMTNRIEYVFLEIPNGRKPDEPDAGPLDRLCYTFGHISEMQEQPEWAKGEFYDLLFKFAEISNFAPYELNEYIKDMTTERDRINQMEFAKQQSREQERLKTAQRMIEHGITVSVISDVTGLSVEEIESLK